MCSKIVLRVGTTLTLMLLAAGLAGAHHGFGAFDRTKTVSITGVVKKVEWINPHAVVHLEVKAANGKVETWAVQTAPPNLLIRTGVSRDKLVPEVVFTATGHPPRAELRDFIFAPTSTAGFVESGHMLYSYDVKLGSEVPRAAAGPAGPAPGK